MTEIPFHPAARAEAVAAMSTFRYSLIVASPGGLPMIYAVAHQHRRPGYWLERIE